MQTVFYEARRSGSTDECVVLELADLNFPAHLHRYIELLWVRSGEVESTVGERSARLGAGSLSVAFSEEIHSCQSSVGSKVFVLLFSPELLQDTLPIAGRNFSDPFFRAEDYPAEVLYCLEKLAQEPKTAESLPVIRGYLGVLFGRLCAARALQQQPRVRQSALRDILCYLQENFLEPVRLAEIAQDLGLSSYYISHTFKNKVGYGINDYVNLLRVGRAQKLLRTTAKPIIDIALECGFETQRHFNRVFLQLIGCTPTQFRAGNEGNGQKIPRPE